MNLKQKGNKIILLLGLNKKTKLNKIFLSNYLCLYNVLLLQNLVNNYYPVLRWTIILRMRPFQKFNKTISDIHSYYKTNVLFKVTKEELNFIKISN